MIGADDDDMTAKPRSRDRHARTGNLRPWRHPMQAIEIDTEIDDNGEIHIKLPEPRRPGPARRPDWPDDHPAGATDRRPCPASCRRIRGEPHRVERAVARVFVPEVPRVEHFGPVRAGDGGALITRAVVDDDRVIDHGGHGREACGEQRGLVARHDARGDREGRGLLRAHASAGR